MTVRRERNIARLEGECRVDDAEVLVALLQSGEIAAADLAGCGQMHSAVVQALAAFRVEIRGEPADPFVRDLVIPALTDMGRDRMFQARSGPELDDGGSEPQRRRRQG